MNQTEELRKLQREDSDKDVEMSEELLEEIDRDSYYWSLNLIDEFEELDTDTFTEWLDDIRQLDAHYRHFILEHVLMRLKEENE